MKHEGGTLCSPASDFAGSLTSRLRVFAELTKLKLVTASTLSTTTGYLIFLRHINTGVLTASLGVLFLALGSCALNQFQDRNYDARMKRTWGRPIPSGSLTPGAALCIASILIASGLIFLWVIHGWAVALIGILALFLYNGFYTYLKRVWPFAAVPGAMIGALPPIIGWTAAGGSLLDPRILALAFLFFIWQVPHFWMLLFLLGKEYEEAGLPALTQVFSFRQLARLTFFWIAIAAASGLLLIIYGVTSSLWVCFALLTCSLWLVAKATTLLRKNHTSGSLRQAFRAINIYALCVMTFLIADALS
jgi:protoheme IX farnesyltransferase